MLKVVFVITILLSLRAVAAAADAVITVNGKVVALPCTVDTTQLTFDLGKIYASTLSKAGSYGEWVNATIKLSACPAVTSSITATFSGQSGTLYFRNTGTARNVELQLQTATAEPVNLNNNSRQTIAVTPARTAELPLRVRVYSQYGKVTEGTLQGLINVTYTYQ
ncbi:fimbrial protein [Aeromonas salmonicida]|uniref:fimbrial protein n=1 Tax=Aeromonas salmonicida TaxID=645 RepID=UPI003D052432